MRLYNILKSLNKNRVVLSAQVESTSFSEPETLYFSYPEKYFDFITESADAFFPAVLIPAMLSGEQLIIDAPVSAKMMKNQPTIQSVFTSWFPEEFSTVNIDAPIKVEETAGKSNRSNATFFSLGVDSMYSMLKYHPDNVQAPSLSVSTLIFMKGLELPLSVYSTGQGEEVRKAMELLAEHFGLELLSGETNIRDVFPLVWENYYSGPGLAATALSLSNGFDNIYVPSSHSYANLSPNPSSPLIDNLWSNERTNIIHDGAEIERAQKIVTLIANNKYALDNLRVCVENQGANFNCGKCWKCIRTMVTLEIIGKLKDAASFPDELPKTYNKQLRTFRKGSLKFTIENYNLARQYHNKEIEKILEREIRVGKLDLFREGKPAGFLIRELLFYLLIKTGRRLRLLPWHQTSNKHK